jgi:hypothetical protein
MHTLLVSVLVVLLVGMWWVFVLRLLSELSGWRKLAAIFRAQHPPSGRCLRMQGGWVGDTLYTGRLTIYTSDEGLYVSIWPTFRFRQPPLLIPWNAMPFTIEGKSGGCFLDSSSLTSERHPSARCGSCPPSSVTCQTSNQSMKPTAGRVRSSTIVQTLRIRSCLLLAGRYKMLSSKSGLPYFSQWSTTTGPYHG